MSRLPLHFQKWPLVAKRCIQQAALIYPDSPVVPSSPPTPRTGFSNLGRRKRLSLNSPLKNTSLTSELSRRVEALAVTSENEEKNASDVTYSEEELVALYEDLLALPNDEAEISASLSKSLFVGEQDKTVVEGIISRLSPSPSLHISSETLSASLLQQTEGAPGQTQQHVHESSSLPHHLALRLLAPIVQELANTRNVPSSASGQDSLPIPPSVLSIQEWRSLTRLCLSHDDPHSAKTALEFVMASGMVVVENLANDVMAWYARRGDILGLEQFMQTFVKGTLTDRQRHLHIKAHEKSVPLGTIPESAISLLHAYENAGHPAPMTAYSRIITALFRASSSLAHAQAWDLFSHMRYVAHPEADAHLFTQMIRTCAFTTPAEPERALDLFTEMTIDRGISPTARAYNAAILACARSGSKAYVNEAFRLAKEMLDTHRDALGRSAFHPDSRTYIALLEGAKRIGDLGRVRWILAGMIEASLKDPEIVVDERIMTHVFHSYSAYRPPFKRSMAPLADQDKGDRDISGVSSTELVESSAVDQGSLIPSFAHLPPQSSSDVIREAMALFSRISGLPPPTLVARPLPTLPYVHVTPRLLNAYLSIFYAHASLERAHELFRTAFAEYGLKKDSLTVVEALERCGRARRGPERLTVTGFAEEAWGEWTDLENNSTTTRVSARHIQRAYSARVRVLSLTSRIDEALTCLRSFVARYPPSTIREPPLVTQRPDIVRTMRVSLLEGARPLVRLTTPLDVQDDHVPPLLTFDDLEVLHHRLVAAGDLRGLAYVKWVCKAYEGALRKRREATLKV